MIICGRGITNEHCLECDELQIKDVYRTKNHNGQVRKCNYSQNVWILRVHSRYFSYKIFLCETNFV